MGYSGVLNEYLLRVRVEVDELREVAVGLRRASPRADVAMGRAQPIRPRAHRAAISGTALLFTVPRCYLWHLQRAHRLSLDLGERRLAAVPKRMGRTREYSLGAPRSRVACALHRTEEFSSDLYGTLYVLATRVLPSRVAHVSEALVGNLGYSVCTSYVGTHGVHPSTHVSEPLSVEPPHDASQPTG